MRIHFLKGIWKDITILESNGKYAFIDTGYEEDYMQIKEYLDKLGVTEISFILLTHFHRDHYGCIPFLVKNYKVNKVYFKDYSGLDKTTANGTLADDEYRILEKSKCDNMKDLIKQHSNLVQVEEINTIIFDKYEIQLFNNSNTIREIYNDASVPEYYHEYIFNENQNSLSVFMNINGVKVYFGGDILDKESLHYKANYSNKQVANKIGRVDVYKVSHHGANYSNRLDTLNILKPKIAVISNGIEILNNISPIVSDLRSINENIKILFTEKSDIVLNIDENSFITYDEK